MKTYELKIEDEEIDEVFAISLVESPAIESDFFYFNKEAIRFAKIDNEQRMLIGAILIPDKKILRMDGEGNPYHVFFTKETVKKLAQNYLMKKYIDKATLEHGGKKIKGVHLVESWVKDGKLDKSNNYGLSLPEGTWVGMFKIVDETLWKDYVKTGKVKGFSVEALMEQELVKAGAIATDAYLEKHIEDLTEEEAKKLIKILMAEIDKYLERNNAKLNQPSVSSTYPGEAAKKKKKENDK